MNVFPFAKKLNEASLKRSPIDDFKSKMQARLSVAENIYGSPIVPVSLGCKGSFGCPIWSTRKKRQVWSKEEDVLLADLVGKDLRDKPNWSGIAEALNFRLGTVRAGKQCRERWRNHLRPNIKKGKWTAAEEQMIRNMYKTFGPKWTYMAALLKDRTDNDIKNKWYSMERSQKARAAKQVAAYRWAMEAAKEGKAGESDSPLPLSVCIGTPDTSDFSHGIDHAAVGARAVPSTKQASDSQNDSTNGNGSLIAFSTSWGDLIF